MQIQKRPVFPSFLKKTVGCSVGTKLFTTSLPRRGRALDYRIPVLLFGRICIPPLSPGRPLAWAGEGRCPPRPAHASSACLSGGRRGEVAAAVITPNVLSFLKK